MNLDNYLLNFEQTTDYPTLDGMHYIMNKFNNPHKKLKFIHVAGTNGKGSICEMLSNILTISNYKVGKFISPHLISSNESISINNINIDDSEVLHYINCISPVLKDLKQDTGREATRFEVLTSISLLYFFDNNCDIIVFEVGMGGRFDCTNIITPIVSAFGSISFDHTAILGNTLYKIASEKAGIIKKSSNTVIFEQEAIPIIKEKCEIENNALYIIKNNTITNYNIDNDYQYFSYKYLNNIAVNLKGKKQIENACIVIETINILNKNSFFVSKDNLLNGLKTVIHPARFEIINTNPLVIFDGAHNENAMINFIETVNSYYQNNKKSFVISIIKTKDFKSILKKLLLAFPNDKFILTSGVDDHNFFSKENLYEFSKSIISLENIYTDNLENAIKYLDSEVNFIVGSFYTYKKVKLP